MREIKFRAWDKENNVMLSNQNLDDYDKDGIMHLYDILKDQEKEGVELMQFTGLKDKNGVDIYEGDIIKTSYGVGYSSKHYYSFADGTQKEKIEQVKYLRNGFDCLSEPCDMNFIKEFEVIGNIYENPELLTS